MKEEEIKTFLKRLEGKEGCNFRKDKKGETIWKCAGGMDKSLSKRILDSMGISETHQKKFLDKCHKLGGHCDCEILFNAAEHL